MEALLAALEASGPAAWARGARWGYFALNGTHILGVALLVGAMVPLNLLRLGWVGDAIAPERAARLLVPFASAGLVLLLLTGAVMFASRAGEYAALPAFQVKMALVAVGILGAGALNLRYGFALQRAGPASRRRHALWSLILWPIVLYLGRAIAFAG